ncbi:MAG: hypothetical protein KatS3mg057_2007 [Herpetosiphonaceae bacterium]|nr:MAG: hypothetical protein KatS3mg057_2007 [Herpetosiphonaceae bacterium]
MHYRFAIEEIEPHHWIAWALDMPGCFSSAKSEHEALAGAPGAVSAYFTWVAAHDPSLPLPDGPVDLEIVERFRTFPSSNHPEYLVNAFFADDRRPLGYWEVVAGLRLLEWSRNAKQSPLQVTP